MRDLLGKHGYYWKRCKWGQQGVLNLQSVCVLTPQCSVQGHYTVKGTVLLWSLNIPGCPSKKSRGVTLASWSNFPIGLWPSWSPNHPHILIGFTTVSSPPISWCVVGGLAQSGCLSHHPGGCCTLVVVEEIPPYYVKRFEYPVKCYINVTNYYNYIITGI